MLLPSSWRAIANILIAGVLLLAFWQLRHTLYFAEVNGRYFEWGSIQMYAVDALALLLVGVFLVFRGIDLSELRKSHLWWPSLVGLGWMTASCFWSADFVVSAGIVAQWWLWAVTAVVLAQSGWRLETAVRWLVAGGLVSALFGAAQFMRNHSLGLNWLGESVLDPIQKGVPVVATETGRQLRSHGLQPHANIFGGAMAWTSAVLVAGAPARNGWVWGVVAAIFGAVLVTSFARGAWLMVAIIVVGTVLIGLKRALSSKYLLAGLCVGAVAVGLWQGGLVMSRLAPDSGNALEVRSIEERLSGVATWKEMMVGNWALGYGWGGYPLAMAERYPQAEAFELNPVHNAALLWVAQLGLVGAFILAWWLAAAVRQLARERRWVRAAPLVVWLGLGMFDHWTVSLHQGVVALFLALALIFWPQEI